VAYLGAAYLLLLLAGSVLGGLGGILVVAVLVLSWFVVNAIMATTIQVLRSSFRAVFVCFVQVTLRRLLLVFLSSSPVAGVGVVCYSSCCLFVYLRRRWLLLAWCGLCCCCQPCLIAGYSRRQGHRGESLTGSTQPPEPSGCRVRARWCSFATLAFLPSWPEGNLARKYPRRA